MIKEMSRYIGKSENRKVLIGLIAVLIAIAAATISILVFLDRGRKKEEEISEECFAE